uniref:Uncharacterized protein n=1 Tax=Cyanothece sp. (strain PCC 7425 / ATCC 29141) TaxID=395961 RepID=B8HPY0_CYAP4
MATLDFPTPAQQIEIPTSPMFGLSPVSLTLTPDPGAAAILAILMVTIAASLMAIGGNYRTVNKPSFSKPRPEGLGTTAE